MSSNHIFFCTEPTCNREVPLSNSKCPACACPGCGDVGATSVGSDYCHTCMSVRNHPCNRAFITYEHEHTGRCGWAYDGSRICNDEAAKAEYAIWCEPSEPHITQERREHNPLRCERCTVAMPHSKNKRFCGTRCQNAYLIAHNCNVWDADMEEYACPECRDCFPPDCIDCGKRFIAASTLDPSRCPTCILCIRCPLQSYVASPRATSLHVCNGDMDYERGYKVCDDRDDPLCPQYRENSVTSPRAH